MNLIVSNNRWSISRSLLRKVILNDPIIRGYDRVYLYDIFGVIFITKLTFYKLKICLILNFMWFFVNNWLLDLENEFDYQFILFCLKINKKALDKERKDWNPEDEILKSNLMQSRSSPMLEPKLAWPNPGAKDWKWA